MAMHFGPALYRPICKLSTPIKKFSSSPVYFIFYRIIKTPFNFWNDLNNLNPMTEKLLTWENLVQLIILFSITGIMGFVPMDIIFAGTTI